jgi:tetratricopeptide (TPR) repeat protein
LNHGDTDDTEIVSGDEGDLPPVEDIAIEANTDPQVEQAVEPTAVGNPLSEVIDQPVTLVNENVSAEPQQQVETNFDWQSPAAEQPLVLVETISEVTEPEKVKSQPNGWQQVRNFFFAGVAGEAARLSNLTQSIEDAPESAVNYILRAELYMGLREYALAQADFQRAVELADTQFELADWGLLDQVMRDRALAGLDKAQRRLR